MNTHRPDAPSKQYLQKLFFKNVPKARSINPFFVEQFELIYDSSVSSANKTMLNIFSSRDLSGQRAEFFRDVFFPNSNYYEIDFWEDSFLSTLDIHSNSHYHAPDSRYGTGFNENTFDVIVTTKVIMEHVSDPLSLLRELFRVLKPGGKLFFIAPHIRRQHQAPYDFFRFTEYSLSNLLNETGFIDFSIRNTGGFMAVIAYYSYFFQRGLNLPACIEKLFDHVHYFLIEPLFFWLDSFDNGYGRDMTLYFMVRATK